MNNLLLKLYRICAAALLLLGTSIAVLADDDVLTQAELDQMLAPVALYPDTVLTHVLIAATYPLELVQAARWQKRNPDLSGEDAVRAVEDKNWDPSVKALVAFPALLQRLSEDLDWTEQLGEAFLSDEAAVLASIQQLREKAYSNGNLRDSEQVVVQRERDVIIIEPARKEVVFVPVYDSRTIYGDWWWPSHPPVYWHTAGAYYRHSPFYWGVSVRVRPWFYFGIFDWQHRHVVVHHHYYHKPPRYYPKRHKHYVDARRWQHNTEHRRGVHYRQERLNRHYNSGYGYAQTNRELKADPMLKSDQRRHNLSTRELRADAGSQRYNNEPYRRKTAEQVQIRQFSAAENHNRPKRDNALPQQHRALNAEQRMRTSDTVQQSVQQKLRQPEQIQRNDKPVAQRHISTEQLRQRQTPVQHQAIELRREPQTVKREPSSVMNKSAVSNQSRSQNTARENRAPQRDTLVNRQERGVRQIE